MINFLDIIIILLFLWKGWRGLNNGFIIELGSFIILYLSFFVSINEYNIIVSSIEEIMTLLDISLDFKWLFSFILVYLILFFLLRLINNAFDSLSLKPINKLLGGIFAIMKCWLILNIIIFALLLTKKTSLINTEKYIFNKEFVRNSALINTMCRTANKYMPK